MQLSKFKLGKYVAIDFGSDLFCILFLALLGVYLFKYGLGNCSITAPIYIGFGGTSLAKGVGIIGRIAKWIKLKSI